MWRTLRFRLALWNVFVVSLTAFVTLLSLRQGVHWAVLHEMDQILLEDVEEIVLSLRDSPAKDLSMVTPALERKASGHRQHGWFVQLLDQSARVVWSSSSQLDDVSTRPGEMAGIPVTHGNLRMVTRELPSASAGVSQVRVGAALTLLTNDLSKIDRMFLLAAGGVLLVAIPLGYWLAGRATSQFGAIITTAQRLRPGHLEERLPITGSGDELDHLAQTINRLLDRLAEYLRLKRDFLANAAHELRTPLAAIKTSIEVELAKAESGRNLENLMCEIIEQGTSLETLVNQLLLISEAEAERFKLDPEPVSFDDIVVQAAEMFSGIAESKNITLSLSVTSGTRVAGSRHLLRQLANNLIDNAIKYTPPHGAIEVTVHPSSLHEVEFRVTDNGQGIPEEDLPQVFHRFFRGSKSRVRDETTGTGLGLSICQAVTDAHQGEIECESRPGRGTTVRVTLPAWVA